MNDSEPVCEMSRHEIIRLLRSHGITPTTQRIKIGTTLLSRPQHLSAEQVLELTNKKGKKVSKATIYNTLGLFTRKGLIRELIVDPSRSFYDSSTHGHHHFFNSSTNELSDIPEGALEITMPEHLPTDTQVDKVEVVVHLTKADPDLS